MRGTTMKTWSNNSGQHRNILSIRLKQNTISIFRGPLWSIQYIFVISIKQWTLACRHFCDCFQVTWLLKASYNGRNMQSWKLAYLLQCRFFKSVVPLDRIKTKLSWLESTVTNSTFFHENYTVRFFEWNSLVEIFAAWILWYQKRKYQRVHNHVLGLINLSSRKLDAYNWVKVPHTSGM